MKKIALATLAALTLSSAAAQAEYAFDVNSMPLSNFQKATDSVETGSIHAAKVLTRVVRHHGVRFQQNYSLNGAGDVVILSESKL